MLAKTRAIVLGSVKYAESSIILRTYTRETGLKSFIASGLRSKKGVVRPSMVQPLSQLNLIYYEKGKGELKRIKEAEVDLAYDDIFYNPVKSSLAMFLAEMLAHLLHEEEPNFSLYDYLSSSFAGLDKMESGLGNFHLDFLYRLTTYVGFAPASPKELPYFDLINGIYIDQEPHHPHYLSRTETLVWKRLATAIGETAAPMHLHRKEREELLRALMEYYRLHVKDFGNLRSLAILKELLA